jgi:hypothetical protein
LIGDSLEFLDRPGRSVQLIEGERYLDLCGQKARPLKGEERIVIECGVDELAGDLMFPFCEPQQCQAGLGIAPQLMRLLKGFFSTGEIAGF